VEKAAFPGRLRELLREYHSCWAFPISPFKPLFIDKFWLVIYVFLNDQLLEN